MSQSYIESETKKKEIGYQEKNSVEGDLDKNNRLW